MKRRKCVLGLTSVLPLISGCSGVLTNNSEPEQEGSETPDRNSSTTHLSLSIESQLTSIEAKYELSLVRGVTQDHPPQIKAVLTNTSDSRREFTFGSQAPLSPQANDGPEQKLHLRTPPSDGDYGADGCWQSTSDAWKMNATIATLQPGESTSNTLDVLAAPDVDGKRYCLPKGEFTFTNKVGEGTLRFTISVK